MSTENNHDTDLYIVDSLPYILEKWQAAHLIILGADVWSVSALFDIENKPIVNPITDDFAYSALVNLYTTRN